MDGLGECILLEGRKEGRKEGREEGIAIGEIRGIGIGKNLGVDLSAEIFKAIQAGNWNNAIIAEQCGCTEEEVAEIREKFGI